MSKLRNRETRQIAKSHIWNASPTLSGPMALSLPQKVNLPIRAREKNVTKQEPGSLSHDLGLITINLTLDFLIVSL
jgi:hypothetical protein